MLVELRRAARADREAAQQQVERVADRVRVGVRPEVARALALAPAHHQRPRPLLVDGHGEERIALVVAQPDVEPRVVLLDQRELEHQRLDLVAHRRPLDRLRGLDHLAGARMEILRRLEVVREALAQIGRLADVDHPAVGVLELVRAGGVGDRAGRWTLHHLVFRLRAPRPVPWRRGRPLLVLQTRPARPQRSLVPDRPDRVRYRRRFRRRVRRVVADLRHRAGRQAVPHQARADPREGPRRPDLAHRDVAARQRIRRPLALDGRLDRPALVLRRSPRGAVGRTKFGIFLAAVIILPGIVGTALDLTQAGVRPIQIAVLLVFIAEYPNLRFFFGIPAWALGVVYVLTDILQLTGARAGERVLFYLISLAIAALAARSIGLLAAYPWIPRIPIGDSGGSRRRARRGHHGARRRHGRQSSRDRGGRRQPSPIRRRWWIRPRSTRCSTRSPPRGWIHSRVRRSDASTTCRRSSASADSRRAHRGHVKVGTLLGAAD